MSEKKPDLFHLYCTCSLWESTRQRWKKVFLVKPVSTSPSGLSCFYVVEPWVNQPKHDSIKRIQWNPNICHLTYVCGQVWNVCRYAVVTDKMQQVTIWSYFRGPVICRSFEISIISSHPFSIPTKWACLNADWMWKWAHSYGLSLFPLTPTWVESRDAKSLPHLITNLRQMNLWWLT